MDSIKHITLVDAFTSRPFSGNPAAVVVCERFLDAQQMQAIAAELNLSETAFVVARTDGDYDLRWFTPTTEVALCGHATLASAHVLGGVANFHTASGVLSCWQASDGAITMEFPIDHPQPIPTPGAVAALGPVWTGKGVSDALIVLATASQVRSLDPDPGLFATIQARCVIVTAPGDQEAIDCVSRVFCPNAGVIEDPVTGSAHCTLAAYWATQLGKQRLIGEQASARGGFVNMEISGDRVLLSGHAVTIGHLQLEV